MIESRKIRFSSELEFHYDYKHPLESWESMREFCAKKGLDIGDFPVITEEEEAELAKQLENIK